MFSLHRVRAHGGLATRTHRTSAPSVAVHLTLHVADVAELEFDRKKVSLAEQLGEGKLGPVLRGTATGIVLPG